MKESKKKKVVIVGAGISGLTLGYELMKDPRFEVAIVDKCKYAGGWIRTLHSDAGIFEIGPRAIRLHGDSGRYFYSLIQQMNLEREILTSAPESNFRHVYLDGKLEAVSSKPWQWLLSKATRSLPWALLQEPFKRAEERSDMTLEAFFIERLGETTYGSLIEPAILGIFGIQGKFLSARATLPTLWEYREKRGSLLLGALSSYLKKDASKYNSLPESMKKRSLISFRLGLCQMIDALSSKLTNRIHYNETLKSALWMPEKRKFHVKTSNLMLEADWVVMACSPWSIQEALQDLPAPWPQFQTAVGAQSLTLVSLAYSQPIAKEWGFGYLVPSAAREHILGCVIDSNVFPEHNRGYPTRLTVMMDGHQVSAELTRDQCSQLAQMAVSKHLKWSHHAKWSTLSQAPLALPIYRLGHLQRLEVLNQTLESRGIGLYFTGLGYKSQSMTQCAFDAHELACFLQSKLS